MPSPFNSNVEGAWLFLIALHTTLRSETNRVYETDHLQCSHEAGWLYRCYLPMQFLLR